MDELEQDGFVRLPKVVEPSAVYCLLREGEVVYVGKSKNVFWRVAQHHNMATLKRRRTVLWTSIGDSRVLEIKFDDVMVLFCPVEDLERLELYYIDRFKPPWNIQIREPLPNLKIDILTIAAQMKWDLKSKDSLKSLRQRKL